MIQGHAFEKCQQFTYLGVTIYGNNDWSIEKSNRIIETAMRLTTKFNTLN